jgi:hypothetical protein
MRQETVTYDVFKFEELDPKVQAKVLDDNRDWNVDHEWYEFTIEDFTEKLESLGFRCPKISFSGFCSQGDGASFEVKSCDVAKLIEALKDRSNNYAKYKKYLTKVNDYGHIALSTLTVNHHYSHENTKRMDLDTSLASRFKRLNALLDTFVEEVESLRYDLCREIYKSLEKEYDYLTSDEAIKESIEANEVEFLATGKRFS